MAAFCVVVIAVFVLVSIAVFGQGGMPMLNAGRPGCLRWFGDPDDASCDLAGLLEPPDLVADRLAIGPGGVAEVTAGLAGIEKIVACQIVD